MKIPVIRRRGEQGERGAARYQNRNSNLVDTVQVCRSDGATLVDGGFSRVC